MHFRDWLIDRSIDLGNFHGSKLRYSQISLKESIIFIKNLKLKSVQIRRIFRPLRIEEGFKYLSNGRRAFSKLNLILCESLFTLITYSSFSIMILIYYQNVERGYQ